MSENRSRYSSAPLQDMRRKPAKQPAPRAAAPGVGPETGSTRSFVLLQVLLVAVLPLLFLVSLLIKDTRLYWGFVIASVLCLSVMALMKAFVPNARRVLGVIHAAMIAVSIFAILVSAPPPVDNSKLQTEQMQSIFSNNSSASMVDMAQAAASAATGDNEQSPASPNPGSASLAQQKLDQFMTAWRNKDYAAMVSYAIPSWSNQYQSQREAETAIFHLSAIRTPLAYQVSDVSGNDSDQTRTITLQAQITKNDGRDPQLYNFQILMIRVNNQWYVDPNSISSSQVVEQAQAPEDQSATVVAAPTLTPDPNAIPVRSDTVLYYNKDGGEYYHINPDCSSIGAKYRPLTATFYYRDVSNDTFKNLRPCHVCEAPKR